MDSETPCGFVCFDARADVVQLLLAGLAQCIAGKEKTVPVVDTTFERLKGNLRSRIVYTRCRSTEMKKLTMTRLSDIIDRFVVSQKSGWGSLARLFSSKEVEEKEKNENTRSLIRFLEEKYHLLLSQNLPEFATEVLQLLADDQLACVQMFKDQSERQEHIQMCSFRPMYCPYNGCSKPISYLRKEEHDRTCTFKIIECPNGCGFETIRRNMSVHLEGDCLWKPIPCTYRKLGCVEDIPQCKLEEHLVYHMNAHIAYYVLGIDRQRSKGQELEQRIYDANDKNTKMKEEAAKKHIKLAKLQKKLASMEADLNSKHNQQMKEVSKILREC
eukprot:CFRG3831T1